MTSFAPPLPLSSTRLFSPRSVFWRINREAMLVLSGPRALLLELAHPLVAAGVAEHSDYRGDPLGRLFRTIGVMTALNFATHASAQQASQHTRDCHRPVQGELGETVGPYLAGTPYRASDPLLRLWVLATLIDSVLVFYERFISPLTLTEKEAYYADGQRLGRALGLPRALMPPTYDDFQTYIDTMLSSDALSVGPQACDIVQALFTAPGLGPAVRLGSFCSIGLTPPHLRAAFGLNWTAQDEQRLNTLAALSRRVRPFIPNFLCVHPQATWAELMVDK